MIEPEAMLWCDARLKVDEGLLAILTCGSFLLIVAPSFHLHVPSSWTVTFQMGVDGSISLVLMGG